MPPHKGEYYKITVVQYIRLFKIDSNIISFRISTNT